ncbi:MAG: acetyl-CoA carboxylase biotin carboxylase subunit [Flavobacteriales bacterium]|nr:acetyl-CoA carboxylase biotin carboxylase subunit [Flavobacteriales bacterium]
MKKILVANRGEIALRVMKSAREMGIATVAVFSEADRNAPFVKYADEAVCIGPPPSNQSYLKGELIIEIATKLGVDGIHPGYGFLSENAKFSRLVSEAGLTFIGPSPKSIETMGNKLAAKHAARKYNIPMVPGTEDAIADPEEAKKTALEVGLPVIIKASAGGGGKGMRIVEKLEELESQMKRAISEAESSFGDGSVFIERYVNSPRHIEIQILADAHGNVVHLFERECSIQRRHQKVVEEAPSSVLTKEIRAAMGKSACDVARSCDYLGAGTVEFLLDENKNYFFLEMNTRLQVEHPVTEMITGVDLVKEQIRIARGEKLSFTQEDLAINGHALEVRVYAEDPLNGFLPDIGKLNTYRRPTGPGVRVDDGFEEGMSIPIYYDPMISKLIVHAANRQEAIAKMVRAIDDYQISGVQTTLPFCSWAIQHDAFKSGNFDTHFVQKYFTPDVLKHENELNEKIAAIAAVYALSNSKSANTTTKSEQKSGEWKRKRTFL